ncbi:hypothetical protein ABXN37_28405 [Piscinibacter sakaiensis]|nr:hypothetical protein [Piscinibacter sakaiensis]
MTAAMVGTTGAFAVENGDFSIPAVQRMKQAPQAEVKGWKTTDGAKVIEIWQSGFNNVKAPPGFKQFAEVNATTHSTLSQEVSGIRAGSQYGFSFFHRGRHSPTEADSIEVTVKDGNAAPWKKVFTTTSADWQNYVISVGTKNGDGPVTLEFRSVSTASGDPSIGNFLTGVKLDSTIKPPACVANVPGEYKWSTDNTQTKLGNGKLEQLGTAKLNADNSATHLSRKGVWQINTKCQVTINWENSKFVDVLDFDGKKLSGKNQIGTIITGMK